MKEPRRKRKRSAAPVNRRMRRRSPRRSPLSAVAVDGVVAVAPTAEGNHGGASLTRVARTKISRKTYVTNINSGVKKLTIVPTEQSAHGRIRLLHLKNHPLNETIPRWMTLHVPY